MIFLRDWPAGALQMLRSAKAIVWWRRPARVGFRFRMKSLFYVGIPFPALDSSRDERGVSGLVEKSTVGIGQIPADVAHESNCYGPHSVETVDGAVRTR